MSLVQLVRGWDLSFAAGELVAQRLGIYDEPGQPTMALSGLVPAGGLPHAMRPRVLAPPSTKDAHGTGRRHLTKAHMAPSIAVSRTSDEVPHRPAVEMDPVARDLRSGAPPVGTRDVVAEDDADILENVHRGAVDLFDLRARHDSV